MMSVIVAMMLVVGMLGCSKESGEGDTSKENQQKKDISLDLQNGRRDHF